MLCNYKIQLPTEAPLAGKLLGNMLSCWGKVSGSETRSDGELL